MPQTLLPEMLIVFDFFTKVLFRHLVPTVITTKLLHIKLLYARVVIFVKDTLEMLSCLGGFNAKKEEENDDEKESRRQYLRRACCTLNVCRKIRVILRPVWKPVKLVRL